MTAGCDTSVSGYRALAVFLPMVVVGLMNVPLCLMPNVVEMPRMHWDDLNASALEPGGWLFRKPFILDQFPHELMEAVRFENVLKECADMKNLKPGAMVTVTGRRGYLETLFLSGYAWLRFGMSLGELARRDPEDLAGWMRWLQHGHADVRSPAVDYLVHPQLIYLTNPTFISFQSKCEKVMQIPPNVRRLFSMFPTDRDVADNRSLHHNFLGSHSGGYPLHMHNTACSDEVLGGPHDPYIFNLNVDGEKEWSILDEEAAAHVGMETHVAVPGERKLEECLEHFGYTPWFSNVLRFPKSLTMRKYYGIQKAGDMVVAPQHYPHATWQSAPGWNVILARKLADG